MKSIIELAIVTQLIDHRDTEESLPADFVQSLREFAALVRAAALEEAKEVLEFHGFEDALPYIEWAKVNRALKEKT